MNWNVMIQMIVWVFLSVLTILTITWDKPNVYELFTDEVLYIHPKESIEQ